ncbi:Telomerase protein component 1 [Perkinsus chesapeaki]|uniref:Telomerase protein component 1 n=1 Tax=Perkinsus chesapeaki TaxID=330153 RepID=A0A7J6MYT4_PERCH|nr:Telomerase protein component 1 [Perkinsus chesapeaki]
MGNALSTLPCGKKSFDAGPDQFNLILSLSADRTLDDQGGLAYRNDSVNPHPVWSVSVTSDGLQLAAACADNRIHLWCLVSFQILISLGGHGDVIWEVAYSPNDEFLLSCSADGTCRLWEVATGFPMAVVRGHSNWVWAITWSGDSRYFATGGTDSRICVWDRQHTGMPLASWLGHVKSVSSLSFSARDASRLVSVSNDSTIAVWDSLTGHLRCRLGGHVGNISCVEVCPMNDNLIATAGEDCSVRLWSLRDLSVEDAHSSRTSDWGFGLQHHLLKGHTEAVNCLQFTNDGRLLASGGADTTIRIWHVSAKLPSLAYKFVAHESWVRSLCWKQDRTMLITASTDGLIALWNVPREYHAPGARALALDTFKAIQQEKKPAKESAAAPGLAEKAKDGVLKVAHRARRKFSFLIHKAIEMGQGGNNAVTEKYKEDDEGRSEPESSDASESRSDADSALVENLTSEHRADSRSSGEVQNIS